MIEVRSFEGGATELHDFVVGVWRKSYCGKMPFPLWTAKYFDWQLGLSDGFPRDHLLAAYEGSRIAGVLPGIPFRFHHREREFDGTIGGWLSVDPDFRRQGVGSRLREQLLVVHQKQGMDGQLGYVYLGSKSAQGNPFWKKQTTHGSQQRFKKLGQWARVLDARRAADWNYHRLEALLIRACAPVVYALRPSQASGVRAYLASDLPVCLELANEMSRATELGIVWDSERLERHLQGRSVGRCNVFEVDGQVRGFCTFHVLPFQGRTEEPLGIFDLIATQRLTTRQGAALVNHCLSEMAESGAVLATKLRSGDVAAKTLIRSGFVPAPADNYLCMIWVDPSREFPKVRRTHMLWR